MNPASHWDTVSCCSLWRCHELLSEFHVMFRICAPTNATNMLCLHAPRVMRACHGHAHGDAQPLPYAASRELAWLHDVPWQHQGTESYPWQLKKRGSGVVNNHVCANHGSWGVAASRCLLCCRIAAVPLMTAPSCFRTGSCGRNRAMVLHNRVNLDKVCRFNMQHQVSPSHLQVCIGSVDLQGEACQSRSNQSCRLR